MSNTRRLHVAPTPNLELAAAAIADPPLHVYAIAPRNDGLWGVWCYACSQEASEYVYPCRVLVATQPGKQPAAVLAAPSKLVEMQKAQEQLHVAQGALAHIADQLGLWDNEDDVLNTQDIYVEIDRLVALTTPNPPPERTGP